MRKQRIFQLLKNLASLNVKFSSTFGLGGEIEAKMKDYDELGETFWRNFGVSHIELIKRINLHLMRRKAMRSHIDFLEGRHYEYYKLYGHIIFDTENKKEVLLGDRKIKSHVVNASMKIRNINLKISVPISLCNIAGLAFKSGEWEIWESGAQHLFSEAGRGGYPVIGLFSIESRDAETTTCRALYFFSAENIIGRATNIYRNILDGEKSLNAELVEKGYRKTTINALCSEVKELVTRVKSMRKHLLHTNAAGPWKIDAMSLSRLGSDDYFEHFDLFEELTRDLEDVFVEETFFGGGPGGFAAELVEDEYNVR